MRYCPSYIKRYWMLVAGYRMRTIYQYQVSGYGTGLLNEIFRGRQKFILVSFFFFLNITATHAQDNANNLLRTVYNNLQKGRDYSVEAHIKVDMPFIRILPIDVKIYFKQKDKFKIKSKGIAIVPRQGFDQMPKMIADTNSYTTMVQGKEKIDTILSTIVNVIPLSDTGNLIFGKLWIDPLHNVILKSQFTTKSNGTVEIEYTYGSQLTYGLPDMMIFSVDAQKFKIPKSVGTNNSDTIKNNNKRKKGKIYITFKNYQINKGIPDNIFKD